MAVEQALEVRAVMKIMNNSTKPERILLFSGKRKSGKDYITDILYNRYYIDILKLFVDNTEWHYSAEN